MWNIVITWSQPISMPLLNFRLNREPRYGMDEDDEIHKEIAASHRVSCKSNSEGRVRRKMWGRYRNLQLVGLRFKHYPDAQRVFSQFFWTGLLVLLPRNTWTKPSKKTNEPKSICPFMPFPFVPCNSIPILKTTWCELPTREPISQRWNGQSLEQR